jgi:hypothetical protein
MSTRIARGNMQAHVANMDHKLHAESFLRTCACKRGWVCESPGCWWKEGENMGCKSGKRSGKQGGRLPTGYGRMSRPQQGFGRVAENAETYGAGEDTIHYRNH